MRLKLISRSEIERGLRQRRLDKDKDEIPLCTVVEPLQVAEGIKKRSVDIGHRNLLDLLNYLVQNHSLNIAPLDIDCLNRSLFEYNDSHVVTGFWDYACCSTIPPERSIHRLIFRPSDNTWWDDGLFNLSELRYE